MGALFCDLRAGVLDRLGDRLERSRRQQLHARPAIHSSTVHDCVLGQLAPSGCVFSLDSDFRFVSVATGEYLNENGCFLCISGHDDEIASQVGRCVVVLAHRCLYVI